MWRPGPLRVYIHTGARTEGSEHGPASVDDLDLTVAGEGLRVGGETGCVPAVVTCSGSLAVRTGNSRITLHHLGKDIPSTWSDLQRLLLIQHRAARQQFLAVRSDATPATEAASLDTRFVAGYP